MVAVLLLHHADCVTSPFPSPEPTPPQRRRDTICVLKDQISRLEGEIDAKSDGDDNSNEAEEDSERRGSICKLEEQLAAIEALPG